MKLIALTALTALAVGISLHGFIIKNETDRKLSLRVVANNSDDTQLFHKTVEKNQVVTIDLGKVKTDTIRVEASDRGTAASYGTASYPKVAGNKIKNNEQISVKLVDNKIRLIPIPQFSHEQ